MRYFELCDDLHVPERWFLADPVDGNGQEINPSSFQKGQLLALPGRLRVPQYRPGRVLELSLTGLAVPVVHERVVSIFERLGLQSQVQFLPAEVEGNSERWFILNILRIIRCIDDERCMEVQYWKPEDERPDKLGQYRSVLRMRIDSEKVGDAHILRPWGWTGVMIVSERLKQALEEARISGSCFIEV